MINLPSCLSLAFIYQCEQGAAQYGAFGLGSAIFAHRAWPAFQSVSANIVCEWPNHPHPLAQAPDPPIQGFSRIHKLASAYSELSCFPP